jgi:serine protease Do
MSVRILGVLLTAASLFHSSAANYGHMLDRVQSSVVRISNVGEDFVCTGFVVQQGRVLTAGHCASPHEDMLADGTPAKLLGVDLVDDLALLDTQTSKHALTIRTSPVARAEDLTAVGYGFNASLLSVIQLRLLLTNQSLDYFTEQHEASVAPGLVMEGPLVGGMSGGPIVDHDGKVVGIAQRSFRGFSYGVGTGIIKAFLKVVDHA